MSQADSPDALIRLKATIAQLQEVLTTLETEGVTLPERALDNLAADAAALVQGLKVPTPPTVNGLMDTEDWVDGTDPATPPPIAPRQRPTPATRRVNPSVMGRRQKPWWQRQKIWLGAAGAAIAMVLIWQFTTRAPETVLEASNPDTTTPIETVETDQPTQPTEPQGAAPKVSAPAIPQPTVEVKPVPEPPRPLTPEQRLLAAIQAQVEDVTQPYGDNIVRSIEANFEQGILRITVGDAWYLLKDKLQDRLGMDMLALAQKLDFTKMRVEDLQGNFVARNPVVGDALVIMKRYQDFAPEE